MPRLHPGQHIHFVGIGGVGLSAIARVLLGKGFRVSGSDRSTNALTNALARDGAAIYQGHEARYVEGSDALIVTSAASPDHVEIAAARERGIPVYKRSDIIADVTGGHTVIAVAGTHGKTTTTAMIAHILIETGRDPNYIIGGILRSTGTNAGVGRGSAFVIEADEYDNMFHGLRPNIAVVTNIEWDHPDFFPTPNEMLRSFQQFITLLPDDGWLVTYGDSDITRSLAHERLASGKPALTYGFDRADYRAANARTEGEYTIFEMTGETAAHFGTVTLQVPGRHNILNALAAILVTVKQGIPVSDAIAALRSFQGTGRRFEVRDEVDGVIVIDDYAHHPTAIRATIEAAKSRYPDRDLWAVWQPHTYSRTHSLMDDYLTAFGQADHVLVTDIYAAREQPVPGVTAAALVSRLQHPDVRHTPSLDDAVHTLDAEVRAPAVVLIMSAGDAPRIGVDFLKRRQEQSGDVPA